MPVKAKRAGKSIIFEEMGKKARNIRKKLWPDVMDNMIWGEKHKREKVKGFTSIPRTLPHFFKIMDHIAENEGPVSNTYFALWCRAFPEHIIKIDNEKEFAFESGYHSQKGVYTWRSKMKKLGELGFIKTAPTPSGDFSWVCILDPYLVIEKIRNSKKYQIRKDFLNAFDIRSEEIGVD